MAKPKIKLVTSNVSSEILKSDAIGEICREEAQRLLEAAGPEFAMKEIKGTKRNSVLVYPTTEKAMYRMRAKGGFQKLMKGMK